LGKTINKKSDRVKEQQRKTHRIQLLQMEIQQKKKHKSEIKPLLEKFQRDFESKTNRKIKYKSDISSVAREYDLY
jgi:hypothetical protein